MKSSRPAVEKLIRAVGTGVFAGCSCANSMGRRASVTVTEPEEKPLRTASFVTHATRGLIRDPKTRRKTMFVILFVALALLVAGTTFLQAPLSPREHPLGFLFFWIVCGWLTLTAMLLALFDVLMVRLESRRERRRLHEEIKSSSPESTRLRQGSGAAEHSTRSTADE